MDDHFPAQSIWVGETSFDPKDPTSWEAALLWITHREGDAFRGQFETQDGNYAWLVEGTARENRIQWKYVRIIREKTPTRSVENGASAEGAWDGKTIEMTYFDPGDASRAVIRLRPLERDTRAAQARVDRAWTLNDSGQLESAIQICNLALKLDDRCVNALICRANAYIKKRMLPLAVADLDRAESIDPSYYMIYVDRSWAWNAAGESAKALADAERAVAIEPKKSEPYYQRGSAYQGVKQYAKAIEDFTKALEIQPNYPMALFERGKTYRFIGNAELAKKDFQQAKKLDPSFDIPD